MLGVEEQYGSIWDGLSGGMNPRLADERNAAHVDAAEALFGGITDRFRLTPKEGQ
jgi:hypothetical protein